jgi:hypothetical protein
MRELSDTYPDAERVLYQACRQMSFAEKWRQMGEIYHAAKLLHAAGVRSRNPNVSDEEIRQSWMRQVLGDRWMKTIEEARHGRAAG